MKGIVRTVQDMKVEFSKEIEPLKKTQSEMKQEMKNSIILIKSSVESLTNTVNHVKNRGMEDKVEKLNHSIKTQTGTYQNFITP